MFGYTFGTLNFSALFFARERMMSQTLTTSIKGFEVRFGRYDPETLPQPISPTRIFPLGKLLAPEADSARKTLGPAARAAPANPVFFRNSRRWIWDSVF